MRSIEINNKKNSNATSKKLLIILFITITPILILFSMYQYNPQSQLLQYIYNASIGLPVLHSANNPLLSSVLSAYCKTAPLWAMIVFILLIKKPPLVNNPPVGLLLKTVGLSSLLYFPMIYMFLLHSTEMTESRKLVQTMSMNDYFLTLFFLLIYALSYLFTVYYLFFIAVTCKELFKKKKSTV